MSLVLGQNARNTDLSVPHAVGKLGVRFDAVTSVGRFDDYQVPPEASCREG
jgi:hypothetical protein